jgi:hypothetical protein
LHNTLSDINRVPYCGSDTASYFEFWVLPGTLGTEHWADLQHLSTIDGAVAMRRTTGLSLASSRSRYCHTTCAIIFTLR